MNIIRDEVKQSVTSYVQERFFHFLLLLNVGVYVFVCIFIKEML